MLMPAIRAMDYPCFCLWRGFWQITRTAPWRRMILHFSHIGLTDGRTFMVPFQQSLARDVLWLPRELPLLHHRWRARRGSAHARTVEDSKGDPLPSCAE